MVSSVSNNNLSSYFTNIISNLMTIERQPLERLTEQRDTLNVQRAVYIDLRSKIDGLLDASKTLVSTSPFYALALGRGTTVSNAVDGVNVLTASAGSSAPTGVYDVTVSHLATAQRRVSTPQAKGSTADLELTGSFYLGGTGPLGQSAAINGTPGGKVTSVAASSTIDPGTHELETGQYTVETQMVDSQLQFRLKDADGKSVAIGPNSSTAWQNVTPGSEYDTGRGLKISFGDAGEAATTQIDYQAMGREITVESTDSLIDISNKINAAAQPGEYGVGATVIGNQLILTNRETGAGNRMAYSSWLSTNLGFGNNLSDDTQDLQKPSDAELKVNGLPTVFTSSKNTGITNIIQGVTLNLTQEGAATVTVSNSTDTARGTADTFITKFNDLISYLDSKTAITKVDDKTYTRGALANDSVFYELRSSLLQKFMQPTSGGRYQTLADIGLTISDSLDASISDASKFTEALTNHPDDVTRLMDAVAGDIMNQLNRFSGTSGYLPQVVSNCDDQIKELGYDITEMTGRLSDREAALVSQYAEYQSQLMLLSYQQQMMSSINSTMSSYS